ncbi:MAG TPA: alginate export family protein [Candidatus Methylomirabilis sp.]|nr:alginate export family protein [Candidatus Methylomirabilis sp.]
MSAQRAGALRVAGLLVLLCVLGLTPVASGQCQKDRPALQMLRYDEDWSFLEDSSCVREPLDHIKYISLGRQDWFLSVGGEIRYKYENYDNPGFGTDLATPNGYILQRYLLHTDWHFGRHVRFFAQFQSGLEEGRNGGPRLTDEDVADLHQAFFDISNSSRTFVLRIGRQEMEFGSGRLIGESEGLNIRRAFDGIRFTRKLGRWNWNGTLMHPVLVRPNTFAIPNHRQTQWGTGFVRPRESGGWAIYYIGLDNKVAAFNRKVGRQVSETIGTRIWNHGKFFDYDTDIILQTGTFGSGHLLGGAVSSNEGMTFQNIKGKPRLGVRFDYSSGDADRTGSNLNTFNPLFPNPVYSSLSALLGPSNVTDAGPTLRIAVDRKTALGLESPFYWRSSLQDGVYGFAGNLIRPGNLSNARFIGVQPGITLDHAFNAHFLSSVAYYRFFTGDFLQQTPPGRNAGYLYAVLTFRY